MFLTMLGDDDNTTTLSLIEIASPISCVIKIVLTLLFLSILYTSSHTFILV